METAFTKSTADVLAHFKVTEHDGLSEKQVDDLRQQHGPNCTSKVLTPMPDIVLTFNIALPEEPPTPIWEMILEQFKDQLVLILLGSAGISFVLALFESEGDWTAFVDPAVVCFKNHMTCSGSILISPTDSDHPHPQRSRRCLTRK